MSCRVHTPKPRSLPPVRLQPGGSGRTKTHLQCGAANTQQAATGIISFGVFLCILEIFGICQVQNGVSWSFVVLVLALFAFNLWLLHTMPRLSRSIIFNHCICPCSGPAYNFIEEDRSTFASGRQQGAEDLGISWHLHLNWQPTGKWPNVSGRDQFIGRRLFGGQHELGLTQQALARQGHFKDHHVVQGIHQLDVHSHCLAHHTGQGEMLLWLGRQSHQLHCIPGKVPAMRIPEDDAAWRFFFKGTNFRHQSRFQ